MQLAYKDASKEEADEKKQDVKDKQCKQCKRKFVFTLTILVVVTAGLILAIIYITRYFSVKEDCSAQYFCPDNWIGFQDKCYYFSEEEKNWNSSSYDCLSQNASLVTIDTTKEKHFLKRFKCTSDHWIRRDMTENLTGQWVDENRLNKGVNVTGNEICFYLNEDDVATARCYTERKWICRKKMH